MLNDWQQEVQDGMDDHARRLRALEDRASDATKAQSTAENIVYTLDRMVVALENVAIEIAHQGRKR